MTVSEIMEKMICYPDNTLHDIAHFIKVYSFARTIGQLEQLDDKTQMTLEIAAIVHDIACPLCREKYGNTNGVHQQEEGMILAKKFLADKDLPDDMVDRVVYLVGHHHTFKNVDGIDYQILLEADYLVNADESNYPEESNYNFLKNVFRTKTGIELMESMYGCKLEG